jgi:outer membrane biosynthesis protein TonB
MNALTTVTATLYAIALWMFAPRSVWDKEVKQAKQNQQTRLNQTPETMPQPKPEPIVIPETKLKSTQKAIPESIPQLDTIPEVTPEPEAIAQPTPEPVTVPTPKTEAIQTPAITDYTEWNITKLRSEAKTRKLNWRPLVDGKRKPLNKPQLIQLLKT